jgi:uncharacterized membrane protein
MKKILIILLGLVLFSIPVLSDSSQYTVTVEIFKNNTAHYQMNISSTGPMSILIKGDVENITTSDDCKIDKETLGNRVNCNVLGSLRIEYDSLIEGNIFKETFDIPEVDNFILIVKLPEGMGLKYPVEDSYSPTYALVGSDGRRPVITWQRENYSGQFQATVAFESVIVAGLPLGLIIAALVILGAGASLFYIFYLKSKEEGIKVVYPVLKTDEKAVFDAIMKHGTGVNQKLVVKDSGYSKAKVSKVLNSLQERNLVKLERIGRSNKVHLIRNLKNKL